MHMLGTLDDLKRYLLAGPLQSDTRWDHAIAQIGEGCSALLERSLRRRLARLVGAQYTAGADRSYVVLDRYPVEVVTAVEMRRHADAAWAPVTMQHTLRPEAGLLDFGGLVGAPGDVLRITFTGGWWWPASGGEVQPVGSAELPADVRLAWLVAAQAFWESIDKTGTGASTSEVRLQLADFNLPPAVERLIAPHRRYALT